MEQWSVPKNMRFLRRITNKLRSGATHRQMKKISVWGGAFFLVVLSLSMGILAFHRASRQPKELVFKRDPSGIYAYTAKVEGTQLTTSLGSDLKSAKVYVARGNSSIEIVQPMEAPQVTTKKGQATYVDKTQNVEMQYTLLPNGLKEDIILKEKPKTHQFVTSLKVNNLTAQLTATGTVTFVNTQDEYQFHFQKPYAIDAKGDRTDNVRYVLLPNDMVQAATISARAASDSAKLLLGPVGEKFQPGTYKLVTEVDPNWLNNPNRAYPITIDPTVIHDTSAEFATGQTDRVKDTGSGSSPSLSTYYQEMHADESTVGLWHFNETSNDTCAGGEDVCDSSGEGNHGTETGTTITTSGQQLGAAARDFDGTNDFVTVTAATELNFTQSQAFTIEAWAETDVTNANKYIFNKQRNTTNELLLALSMSSSGVPSFVLGKQNVGSTSITGKTLTANTWYHFAGVSDGTYMYFYINGELQGTAAISISASTQSLADVYFGELYDGTGRWDGTIDEIRVSKVARTPEEIKLAAQRRPYSVFTSDVVDFSTTVQNWTTFSWSEQGVQTGDGETVYSSTNLIGAWNFNESSGTAATNNAGSGTCGGTATDCDGTLTNFATTTGQDAAVLTGWTNENRRWGGGALMFDGSNDYVACTDANCGSTSKLDFTASDDFTLEAWFKTTVADTTRIIMSKRDSAAVTNAGYTLFFDTSNKLNCRIGDGTNTALWTSTGNYSDSHWHHVACVIDRTAQTITVYVDGKLENGTTSTSSVTGTLDNALDFRIGALAGATPSVFSGIIDTVRVYRRALGASEVASNYNVGSLEIQTRVGSDSTPNDGSGWEDWKPTSTETAISSLDSASSAVATGSSLRAYSSSERVLNPEDFATDNVWVKYNNTVPPESDVTGTDGRLALGTTGTGDDLHVYFPSVLKDGSTYKMWYGGHDGTSNRIFYATSPDGLTWTKYDNSIPSNSDTTGTNGRIPLGASGTGDDTHAYVPSVIKDGDIYKMWYTGNDGTNARIYYATSSDGLTWTKYNNAVPSASSTTGTDGRIPLGANGSGDDVHTYSPQVIKDGDTYKMWYAGHDGTNWRVYMATSSDGLTWTKVNNTAHAASNALNTEGRLGLGSGTGDTTQIAHTAVMKDGDIYKMWYDGGDGTNDRTYMAVSLDGENWMKVNNATPTASDYVGSAGRIPLGVTGSGDDVNAHVVGGIIEENGKYRIWYGGSDGTSYRIYTAEMVPVQIGGAQETVIKQEGSASTKVTTGSQQAYGKIEGLWHFEETSGSGAYVNNDVNEGPGTISTGDGADGSVSISSSKNLNTDTIAAGRSYADGIAYRVSAPELGDTSVTRSSGSDTLSNGITAGDEVLVINLQGATSEMVDVGNYEFKEVQSVTASTITFTSALTRSYNGTTAGNQKVVVQRVPNYTSVTISTGGTLTASAWDGLTTTPTGTAGYLTGIVAFRATGTVSIASGTSITASSLGWRGGTGSNNVNTATQGESRKTGAGGAATNAANDGGGGRGGDSSGATAGGAGGGGYADGPGANGGSNATGGTGTSGGDTTMGKIYYGSGGGGGYAAGAGSAGGRGGGIVWVTADTVTVSGGITANGANGSNQTGSTFCSAGGGGAGGGIYLSANTLTVGTTLVTATAGTGGDASGCSSGNFDGGPGSAGKIRLRGSTISGTTSPTADTFGTNGDLTVNGGVTSSVGVVGRAYTFNGSTGYLSCTDAACGGTNGLDVGSSQWTVGAWVKTSAATALQGIISKMGSSGGGNWSYYLRESSTGTAEFGVSSNGTAVAANVTGTTAINDGKWHHIVATYTPSSSIAIYVDGVLQNTNSTSIPASLFASSADFLIGCTHDSTTQCLDGSIDEPFVGRWALTTDQISEMYRMGQGHRLELPLSETNLGTKKRLPFYIAADRPGTYIDATIGEGGRGTMGPDENTVLLWHLEGQTGASDYLKDSSTFANDGTPTGTAVTNGKVGRGRSFDGTDDYVQATQNGTLNITGTGAQVTAEAWVNVRSLSNTWQAVFYKGNSSSTDCAETACSDRQYALFINTAGSLHVASTTTANIGVTSTTATTATGIIQTNTWYHLAIVVDSSGGEMAIYVNGVKVGSNTFGTTIRSAAGNFFIGTNATGGAHDLNGVIDEVRVSNVARTPAEIRESYEIGKRTHSVTIDFGAVLDSGNLIANSGDTSFTVDGTVYGLANKGSNLYYGDKIIVKENVSGTEYIAQGTVTAVTPSTGAVTVASWDSGSTFPAGGYTASASVFKWQREYWDVTGAVKDQLEHATNLTFHITSGNEGRTIYLDDWKSVGNYLTTPGGSTINSSTGYRYFQYRVIPTSSDYSMSPSFTSVTVTADTNNPPSTPTLDSPSDAATNQSRTVALKTTTTDPDSDYLRYKIQLCTDLAMTTGCYTFDQTSEQTGWSGQDAQTSTAYASGTQATFTVPTGLLSANTTYYWRSYAIDPAGANTWSGTQGTPRSFTTVPATAALTPSCTLSKTNTNTSITVQWTDVFTGETDFTVQKSTNGGAFGALASPAANSTSTADSSVAANNTYQYRVRANFGSEASDWCTTSTLSLPDTSPATDSVFSFEGVELN